MVREAERHRSVVAVENGDRASGADNPSCLAQYLQRVLDVADERVKYNDVELTLRARQIVRIAGPVGHVVGQAFIRGQLSGGIEQRWAVVDADQSGVRGNQLLEGAHLDAGPTTDGQNALGGGQRET